MTTTKSFSNGPRMKPVFISALKRQAPFAVGIMIVLFLIIQLPVIMSLIDYQSNPHRTADFLYSSNARFIHGYVVSAIFAIVLALSANGYMHSKQAVDLYHSIPVTRRELLTAHFAASIVTLAVPYALNILIASAIEAAGYYGAHYLSGSFALWLWFIVHDILGMLIYVSAVYLFVTFIAANVGTVFDALVASGAVGVSVLFIYAVSGSVWAELAYGASFSANKYMLLLSPFSFIFYKFTFWPDALLFGPKMSLPVGETLLFYFICIIAAALLYFAAVWAYKRRKSEIARQTQADGLFQTIVKMIAAFAGAALLFAILSRTGWVAQTIGVIAGALMLGIVAELIMSRGIRRLHKNIKWLIGSGLVCGLAVIAVTLDVTGFVGRVPHADTVESVTINYSGRQMSLNPDYRFWDGKELVLPESIEVVTSAHKAWVEQYKSGDRTGVSFSSVELEYKLKNGLTLKRSYRQIPPGGYAMLAGLEDKNDFIMASSHLFLNVGDGDADRILAAHTHNALRNESAPLPLHGNDMERLISAVKQDMLNETLSEMMRPSTPSPGYIRFYVQYPDLKAPYPSGGRPQMRTDEAVALITREYVNTIGLLKELGFYDQLAGSKITPDTVYIIDNPSHLWRYSVRGDHLIVALSPSRDDDDYSFQEISRAIRNEDVHHISTQTREEAMQIAEKAANQMFVSQSDGAMEHGKAYLAVFSTDGVLNGSLLIHEDDLPARMREELKERERSTARG